jgi:predicted transcriptional regulator of viral defense system
MELNDPIITKATVKKQLGCKDNYAYTVLNRLFERDKIKKIIKGKYTTKDDINLIASNIYTPSYISFWTASYLKGYTEQIVNTIQIATTRKKKTISFENYQIMFQKLSPDMFFGYEKIKSNDDFIFIAKDEKLIIDCIQFEEHLGNFDEIIKIVQKAQIDQGMIIKYLKQINNTTLTKKIGFLLEKFKNIDISEKIAHKNKNITPLSKYLNSKKINKKWQVKYDL